MKPPREHYPAAFKKRKWEYLILTVVVGLYATFTEDPLPASWTTSSLLTVLLVITTLCTLYVFVRREGSLETALILGALYPGVLVAVVVLSPEINIFGYVLLGICGPALVHLTWRDYLRQRRGRP